MTRGWEFDIRIVMGNIQHAVCVHIPRVCVLHIYSRRIDAHTEMNTYTFVVAMSFVVAKQEERGSGHV
jgi:hypothetical protein